MRGYLPSNITLHLTASRQVSVSVRLHEKRRSNPAPGCSRACLSFHPKEVWYVPSSPTPDAVPEPPPPAPGHAQQRGRVGRLAAGLAAARHRGCPAPHPAWADDLGLPVLARADLL